MSDETTLTIKEAQQKIEESKAIVNEKLKLLNEKLSKNRYTSTFNTS